MLTNMVTEMNQSLTDVSSIASQNSEDIADLKLTCSNLNTLITRKTDDLQAILDDHEYRITTLEHRPLALVRYRTGESYVRSQLTYGTYGNLYQVAKDFVATTMEADIEAGNIVAVTVEGSAVITVINERVDELAQSVDTITTSVNTVSETVATVSDTVDTLSGRVDSIEMQLDEFVSENDVIQGTL